MEDLELFDTIFSRKKADKNSKYHQDSKHLFDILAVLKTHEVDYTQYHKSLDCLL